MSTSVRIGSPNASHNRTNRAAFSEALMSNVPARQWGWLATTPTGSPWRRASVVTMFGANCSCSSSTLSESTIPRITVRTSYGLRWLSGMVGIGSGPTAPVVGAGTSHESGR